MPKNGSQSHVTTNCLASSLTLQVEVDALRICLSLSIEQNEKGRERGGEEGENTLQLSSLKSSSVRIRQRMTKENDNTCSTWFLFCCCFFFLQSYFSSLANCPCHCDKWSRQSVPLLLHSPLPCLLPQVEQIKRMQSSFSWQCFLTHTVQEVAEGTKRCPNIFYTFS